MVAITFLTLGAAEVSLSATGDGENVDFASIKEMYVEIGEDDLSFEVFRNAMMGYHQIVHEHPIGKTNLLTIIDFNKSSTTDRLFIVDVEKRQVIHKSLVAHGKNSGWDIPTKFSNQINSYQSSLGFYMTGETYTGKHGLSLKLDGLEEGINDNARDRYIVIHSASYVSKSFIKKAGRLGRSFGCPSLPSEQFDEVIDIIKNRSILFIYANQRDYFKASRYL